MNSQEGVQSLHKIYETPLLLTKMESIRGEVAGEACSLWILKTVVDLSTLLHGKIVVLIFRIQSAKYHPNPGLAS